MWRSSYASRPAATTSSSALRDPRVEAKASAYLIDQKARSIGGIDQGYVGDHAALGVAGLACRKTSSVPSSHARVLARCAASRSSNATIPAT